MASRQARPSRCRALPERDYRLQRDLYGAGAEQPARPWSARPRHGGGTCPTSPLDTSGHEGTALGGTGGAITLAPISPTNSFLFGATGITSKNGQHFCGIVGEYGADSAFPGAQFASFVDDRGNALPGAPALVPWLNEGTANFTGYVTVGTQSPSSPGADRDRDELLRDRKLDLIQRRRASSHSRWAPRPASFQARNLPSLGLLGANLTYVAVAGTSGTTVVGNPLSGPVGIPQAIATWIHQELAAVSSPSSCPTCRCSASPTAMSSRPMGRLAGRARAASERMAWSATPTTSAITAKIDNGAGAAGNDADHDCGRIGHWSSEARSAAPA